MIPRSTLNILIICGLFALHFVNSQADIPFHNFGNDTQQSKTVSKSYRLFNSAVQEDSLCTSTSSKATGVCMSKHRCIHAQGTASGNCNNNDNTGVCCVVNIIGTNKPIVVSQPVVNLKASGVANSKSIYEFPKQVGICQLKLNYLDTTLENPEKGLMNSGNCVKDAVTISGSLTVRHGAMTVCGNLVDQHMYLAYGQKGRSASASEKITITVQTTSASAKYSISVVQIRCDSPDLVNEHCLQQFNADSGTVKSFGFPYQLNNQFYLICTNGASPGANTITWNECPASGNGKKGPQFFVTGMLDANGMPPPPKRGRVECSSDYIENTETGRHCGGSFPKFTDASAARGYLTVKFDEGEIGHTAVMMDLPASLTTCSAIFFPGHTCRHPPMSPTSCICTLNPEFPIKIVMPVLQTEMCPTVAGYECSKTAVDSCGCVQQYNEADLGNTGFCLQFTHNYV